MARSLTVEIYYHIMWSQLSTTCSNATEVAQWKAPSWSGPKPAMDNGATDGRSDADTSPPALHRAVMT